MANTTRAIRVGDLVVAQMLFDRPPWVMSIEKVERHGAGFLYEAGASNGRSFTVYETDIVLVLTR